MSSIQLEDMLQHYNRYLLQLVDDIYFLQDTTKRIEQLLENGWSGKDSDGLKMYLEQSQIQCREVLEKVEYVKRQLSGIMEPL